MTLKLATLTSDERSELLLDFVKGRASDEQAAAIRQASQTDEALAEEIAYYQGLDNALRPNKAASIGDELGWARLEKAINSKPAPIAANDNMRLWKYAAAAFAVISALQAAMLMQTRQNVEEPLYVAASDANLHTASITVAFREDASLDGITALLQAVDGRIVDGPSALDLYVVSFASDEARDRALSILQDADEIIENATVR